MANVSPTEGFMRFRNKNPNSKRIRSALKIKVKNLLLIPQHFIATLAQLNRQTPGVAHHHQM